MNQHPLLVYNDIQKQGGFWMHRTASLKCKTAKEKDTAWRASCLPVKAWNRLGCKPDNLLQKMTEGKFSEFNKLPSPRYPRKGMIQKKFPMHMVFRLRVVWKVGWCTERWRRWQNITCCFWERCHKPEKYAICYVLNFCYPNEKHKSKRAHEASRQRPAATWTAEWAGPVLFPTVCTAPGSQTGSVPKQPCPSSSLPSFPSSLLPKALKAQAGPHFPRVCGLSGGMWGKTAGCPHAPVRPPPPELWVPEEAPISPQPPPRHGRLLWRWPSPDQKPRAAR